MDDVDHAQELNELFRSQALDAHFRRCGEEFGAMIENARICRGCGEEIDPDRLAAKPDAVRCIDCQGKKERKRHGIV